jgi:ribosomal protein S18 acetylase RimI-like enzyme
MDIRHADLKDIEFVRKAIIESEKSGTDRLIYTKIFSIPEIEVKEIIRNVLKENITGQQYCLSNFLISEIDGEYAGASCSWVEGETGLSSSIIRANLLLDFIDHNNFATAKSLLKIANEIGFPRKTGAIQIENVFVENKFRGKGISGYLIEKHIQNQIRKTLIPKVQIILAKTNENALKSYIKSGFHITAERTSDKKEILDILPSNTNILMEKEIK